MANTQLKNLKIMHKHILRLNVLSYFPPVKVNLDVAHFQNSISVHNYPPPSEDPGLWADRYRLTAKYGPLTERGVSFWRYETYFCDLLKDKNSLVSP